MNQDGNDIPAFSPVLSAFDEYVTDVRLVAVLCTMMSDRSTHASQFGSCINSTIDEWRNLTTRFTRENALSAISKLPSSPNDEIPLFLAKVRRDKSLVARILSIPAIVPDAASTLLKSLGQMRSLIVSKSQYAAASLEELEETNRVLGELVCMTACDIESADAVSLYSSLPRGPERRHADGDSPPTGFNEDHVALDQFVSQERTTMMLCDNESIQDRLQRKRSQMEQAIAENRRRSFEVPDVDIFANECVSLHMQIRSLEKALGSAQIRLNEEQIRKEAASRITRLTKERRDAEREVQSMPIPVHLIDRTTDAALVIQTHLRVLKARQTYMKLVTAKKK